MTNSSKLKAFSLIELSIVVLIIGIIIAGVIQGSRMVAQARLKTAQNQTSSSPVSSMPNLGVWLETTLPDGLYSVTNGSNPENNDNISLWRDINQQSLNKVNVAQTGVGGYPSYIANGIGGIPTLYFDGSTDYLINVLANTVNAPISINNPRYTMIVVAQPTASASAGGSVILAQQLATGWDMYAQASINVGPFVNNGPSFGGGGNDFSGSAYVQNKVYITQMVLNGNAIKIYSNSNTPISGTLPNNNLGPSGNAFSVGVLTGTPYVNYFLGNISEIIIFDRALKQSEVNDINNYLAKKYSVKLS